MSVDDVAEVRTVMRKFANGGTATVRVASLIRGGCHATLIVGEDSEGCKQVFDAYELLGLLARELPGRPGVTFRDEPG